MSEKAFLLNIFNIKKKEGTDVLLLFTFSFCLGIPYAFLYTSATSLFLSDFNVNMLPYAYMAGGLMSYGLWLIYHKLEKKFNFSRLIFLGFLFLFISLTLLSLGHYFTEIKLYTFLLFVWINVFIFFTAIGFWGIASKVFNLRQGKRLFGLISSGEILSKTLSFFAVPFILKTLETKDLLFFVVSGFFLSFCFLIIIIKKYNKLLSIPVASKAIVNRVTDERKKKSIFAFLQNKYFAYIIILAIFPLFATYFVDFIFLNQTKMQFASQDLVSSFLSIFFGIMAVVEFFLKSFISGRLISKFGILFSLLILPVVLAIFTIIAAFYGTIYGATVMFFSFIILNKLFVRVFRTSFLDPSFQILYQPIPSNERLAFQSKVEGVPKSIGNVIVGATLILFANISSLTVVHYNYLFVIILSAWVWLSYKLYLEYRATLKHVLKATKEKDNLPAEEKSNLSLFYQTMKEKSNPNFDLLLNLLNQLEPRNMHSFLQKVLVSATSDYQEKILAQIKSKRILSARQLIGEFLHTNKEIKNRASFQDTFNILENARKIDIDTLSELSYSSDPQNRLLAANLLSYSGRYGTFKLLFELLQDDNPTIRKAVIITSGRIGRAELWPYLINNLFKAPFASTAASAIKMIGAPILSELAKSFDKTSTPKHVKLKIISIYSSVHGDKALGFLKSNIQYPDEDIRHRTFIALSKMGYHEKSWKTSIIKDAIEEEISMTLWVMSAILDIRNDNRTETLEEALNYELLQKKENVFLLLSMIYDSKTILYIRETFKTGTPESRVFATEILDLTVSADLKDLFLPLLDELSLSDTLRYYRDSFPQIKMTVYDRLKDIINKNYLRINRWTKACALVLLKHFPNSDPVLLSNIFNPDPFLKQISTVYLSNRASERFETVNAKLYLTDKEGVKRNDGAREQKEESLLFYDKVQVLKTNLLFSSISKSEIAKIIEDSREITMEQNGVMYPDNLAQESLLFVMTGAINIYQNKEKIGVVKKNEVFWRIAFDLEKEMELEAATNTLLLEISPEVLYETMQENSEYTKEVIATLSNTA